jgi:PIN domain nuclease of toxin-antitoxin system
MKLLLDTCTLLWWWSDPNSLSERCLTLLKKPSTTVYISAASAWEISTKYRIGKYPEGGKIIRDWDDRLQIDRFTELYIKSTHALKAGSIPSEHRDPFDRMIAAQGIIEDLPVATPDPAFEALGAAVLW